MTVEAAVSAYDDNYFPAADVVRWTRLDAEAFDSPAQQTETIQTMIDLAKQNSQPLGYTNFEAAMQGAFDDMRDRGGCKVVFWFTDGSFEPSVVDPDEARTRMCSAGGLMDQIREAGIVVIGIQVHTDSKDLWPMAEGEDDSGNTCGTVPMPEGWAPGLYLRADDTAGLIGRDDNDAVA